jgi:hypothetical protein
LLRLLEPTLPDSQPGEAGERLAVQGWARFRRDVQCGSQLAIGFDPAPARNEDPAVQRAALGVEERAAVLLDETVRHPAPLRRSLHIGGHLARVQHVAARVHHRVQTRPFAAERARHRLVDHREPRRAVAHRDPDASELRERDELEVDVVAQPGDREGALRELGRGVEIGHLVGAGHPRPGMERPDLHRAQEAFHPGDPAVGRRRVAEVRLVGDAQQVALRAAPSTSPARRYNA